MAITLNSGGASSGTDSSSTTLTFAHTVNAGSNKILIVGIGFEDTATCPTVTGVTFNTTEDLIQIGTQLYASDKNRVTLWYLLNPTVTTANIVITASDTVTGLNGGAITIDGAKQQAPEADNKAGLDSASSPTSVAITTLTNNAWIIDTVGNTSSGNPFSVASGQTERYNTAQNMAFHGGTEEIATAGEQTAQWSFSGTAHWGTIIASFEEYSVGAYTITADGGSFALSGQATNLLKGSLVDIEASSYALTGQVMTPLKGSLVDIASGSYTLTGQVVGLLKTHIIDIASGSYALSGQTVGLFFGWRISIDAGSYALTGQVADLLKGSKVSIDVGSYALTGQVAGVYYGRKFSVDSGSYSLSGQIASLLKGSKVGIDSGSYALTGQVVNLLKGSHVDIEAGAYTLSGQIASLLKSSHIDLASGTYILTGFAVDLILSAKIIEIEPGVYILTGFAADLDYVSVGFPVIFDVEPRERIFDLTGRTRIYNISPRGRIFDREN